MQLDQIPNRDKFESLMKGLTDAEPVALALANDPVHRQSGHCAAALGKIRAAIDNLKFHVECLARQPAPPPAPATSPTPADPNTETPTKAANE